MMHVDLMKIFVHVADTAERDDRIEVAIRNEIDFAVVVVARWRKSDGRTYQWTERCVVVGNMGEAAFSERFVAMANAYFSEPLTPQF